MGAEREVWELEGVFQSDRPRLETVFLNKGKCDHKHQRTVVGSLIWSVFLEDPQCMCGQENEKGIKEAFKGVLKNLKLNKLFYQVSF